MYELAKGCVFLRWATNHGKRPDRVLSVVDPFNLQNWKIMSLTVIAKVVTKGTLGHLLARVNCSADTEVCLVVDR